QRAQQSGVHRLQHSFFLLEFTQHGVGTDMQGSRRITHPTGIETHVDDRLFDCRQAPTVAIVEEKTSPDTEGILAEVALGAPGCFAAFDDLVTLTVRAADRDERHGPFLPKRDYEDEAQCDSNLSPSPLLKHYPMSMPTTLSFFMGLASCGYMILLVLKSFWLIAAEPHRGRVHFITTRVCLPVT